MEQEIADLASVVLSPGWKRFVKPALESLRLQLLNALVMGGAKDLNGNPVSDEELKGRIKNVAVLLEWDVKYVDAARQLAQIKAAMERPAEPEDEPIGSIHDPRVIESV